MGRYRMQHYGFVQPVCQTGMHHWCGTTKTTLETIRDRTSVIYANWPTVATSSMPKIAKNISKYANVLCGNICEVFELVNDGEIILADHKIILNNVRIKENTHVF